MLEMQYHKIPPIVSYKYTKMIAGRIVNQLDIDRGTKDMLYTHYTQVFH